MAQAQDIRRQLGDVSPNTFVRPGVVDESAGLMAKAIGEGVGAVVEIDKELAKQRFGNSLETLRSQYLAGNVASGQLQNAEEDDGSADVGTALTGADQSSLKDFEKVLAQSNAAVEQGRMTRDAFNLRAERLYRVAISKRPGLSREFRSVAQDILGQDVVGASIDILADREKELLQAGAASAKSKAEADKDQFKFMRDEMVKNGFATAGLFKGPGPQWDAYVAQNFDAYQQKVAANETARLSKQHVDMLAAQGQVNKAANGKLFADAASAIEKSFTGEVQGAVDMLRQSGKINDYNSVQQVYETLMAKLNDNIANLNASATSEQIDESQRALGIGRLQAAMQRLQARLGPAGEAKHAEDLIAGMQAEAKYSLLTNDDLRMQTTLYNLVPPPVADRIAKSQEPQLILASTLAMQGVSTPRSTAVAAKDILYNVVGAVWPTGRGTPDAQSVSGASQALATLPRTFYEQEAEQFNFSKWSGPQGLLPAMAAYAPKMTGLTDEQRQKIAAEIAGSAAWGTSVALRRLYQKAPQLQGRVDLTKIFNPEGGTRLFVPAKGQTWTPEEQRLADSYSGMVNPVGVAKAVQAFAPELKSSEAIWRYIAQTREPMKAARAAAQERAQGSSTMGGARAVPGRVQTGNGGPSTRWWDQ